MCLYKYVYVCVHIVSVHILHKIWIYACVCAYILYTVCGDHFHSPPPPFSSILRYLQIIYLIPRSLIPKGYAMAH